MTHPTPAQIKDAIFKKLDSDFKHNPYGGISKPIPMRAFRLISEAITEACDEAENARAS